LNSIDFKISAIESAWFQPLHLKCDILVSNFAAFECSLFHYDVVRSQGVKESHAMQMVSDADHLNALAKNWEAAAAAAAEAAATSKEDVEEDVASTDTDGGLVAASDATAAGTRTGDIAAATASWHLRGWAPFDELARLATDSLEKCVAGRISELLVSSSAASDWAPDSPPVRSVALFTLFYSRNTN
jgi:hypothetical protein